MAIGLYGYGYMDIWVCFYMAVWIYGQMDIICICMYIDVWLYEKMEGYIYIYILVYIYNRYTQHMGTWIYGCNSNMAI